MASQPLEIYKNYQNFHQFIFTVIHVYAGLGQICPTPGEICRVKYLYCVFINIFHVLSLSLCPSQVFGIVSKREMAAHSSHNFPSSIFTSIYRKGASFLPGRQMEKLSQTHFMNRFKLPIKIFAVFIYTPTLIDLHAFCPSSSHIGLY